MAKAPRSFGASSRKAPLTPRTQPNIASGSVVGGGLGLNTPGNTKSARRSRGKPQGFKRASSR